MLSYLTITSRLIVYGSELRHWLREPTEEWVLPFAYDWYTMANHAKMAMGFYQWAGVNELRIAIENAFSLEKSTKAKNKVYIKRIYIIAHCFSFLIVAGLVLMEIF